MADRTHAARVARYRKRHPEKYAALMRRHNRRAGSLEKDFGGHRRGRVPWSADEEQRVLDHTVPDRQLAEELGRTKPSIIARRWQIKQRNRPTDSNQEERDRG